MLDFSELLILSLKSPIFIKMDLLRAVFEDFEINSRLLTNICKHLLDPALFFNS